MTCGRLNRAHIVRSAATYDHIEWKFGMFYHANSAYSQLAKTSLQIGCYMEALQPTTQHAPVDVPIRIIYEEHPQAFITMLSLHRQLKDHPSSFTSLSAIQSQNDDRGTIGNLVRTWLMHEIIPIDVAPMIMAESRAELFRTLVEDDKARRLIAGPT